MVLEPVVDVVAGWLGASGVQTGVIAFLAAVALYARRLTGFGSVLASWVRSFALVAGVLALLLATGVLEGVDTAALMDLVRTVVDVLADPVLRFLDGV